MSDVRNWKVLIVEDEADAMEMVQGLLEYYGVSTWGVATAEAALEVLQDVHPTMIIIDLNLPGIDGWALLKCLRQNNSLMNIPRVSNHGLLHRRAGARGDCRRVRCVFSEAFERKRLFARSARPELKA